METYMGLSTYNVSFTLRNLTTHFTIIIYISKNINNNYA